MALLAFWSAPRDEDVDQVRLHRSGGLAGPWSHVATFWARDGYDNWISGYVDENAPLAAFYKVEFFKSGVKVEESAVRAGEVPYAVTPQMVRDTIQGIPLNRISDSLIQMQIRFAVEWVELQIRQKLSLQLAQKEIYSVEAFKKVMGPQTGYRIQLRNFPVIKVDGVYYKIRGAVEGASEMAFESLDVQIEGHNPTTGYNRGQISVWPRLASLRTLFSGLSMTSHYAHAVSLLFTYRWGWVVWPPAITQLVTEMAAACTMEIAGEAETAGLSSRSVDGYAESYTASATTTVFSARRIWYESRAKEIVKHHRKPLWG